MNLKGHKTTARKMPRKVKESSGAPTLQTGQPPTTTMEPARCRLTFPLWMLQTLGWWWGNPVTRSGEGAVAVRAAREVALAGLRVVGGRPLLQSGPVVQGGRLPLALGLGSGSDSRGRPDARRRGRAPWRRPPRASPPRLESTFSLDKISCRFP